MKTQSNTTEPPSNPYQACEDIKSLRRELAWEALDGLVTQVEGAQRFLTRGDDAPAAAAMRRAHSFFKQAASTMNELIAPEQVSEQGSSR